MKQKFAFLFLILALGFVSIAARAQDEPVTSPAKTPKWVSDKGFWVVETTTQPHQCTVYFYNNDKELVYKEAVDSKMKLQRRKTLLYMKSVLETAVAAYEKKQPLSGNERFFVAMQK
jgi:hypothetical protein